MGGRYCLVPRLAIWFRGIQEVFVKQFAKVFIILKFLEKQNKTHNKNTFVTPNSIKHILRTGKNQ